MKYLKSCAVAACLTVATGANAGNILVADYWGSNFTVMESALESAGHTVDFIDGRGADAIANAMGAAAYDSVFIFDVTTANYMSSNDLTALNALHNAASSMVIDTQSYNYTVWDTADADGLNFLTNVADEFDLYGGGIFLGADHPPEWTTNTNAVLASFGMDLISDSVSTGIDAYDVSSPLFDNVNPLNWRSSSYGEAISGLQGGQMFDVLATSNGSALISASFVQGSNVNVSEPGTLALLGLGLLGLGFSRKKSQA